MKTLFLTVAFFFFSLSAPPQGGPNLPPQQLLGLAMRQGNLTYEQDSPFQLDADFLAQMRIPTHGHLTLKWEAEDQWWTRIVMGSFELTYIRNGDHIYINRNTSYTPTQFRNLIRLLQFAEGSELQIAKKQELRVEKGVEVACLQVERVDRKREAYGVCVDESTHDVLSEEWQEPPDGQRSERLSDYAEFGRHRYPRKLKLRLNGVTELAVDVTGLTTIAFDPSWLAAPDGAVERHQCADMLRAVPIKTPQPGYPHSAIENGMIGDTTASMIVQADGSVGDIQVVGRASQGMDEATLKALRRWRFLPARCGAESVVSDFVAMVSFRLVPDETGTNSLTTRFGNALTIMRGPSPAVHYSGWTSWHELR